MGMLALSHLSEDSLVKAIDDIEEEMGGLSEAVARYVSFLVTIRRFHFSWHDPKAEGSLWSIIGERDGPTVTIVEVSKDRESGDMGISPFSKGDFDGEYPGNLGGFFESMEADEMMVTYTDSEYSEKFGMEFAGQFMVRNPSEEDEEEISSLMAVIPPLIGIEDPLSKTQEERTGGIDLDAFFSGSMRNVAEAFERLMPCEMSPLQKDLFQFASRAKGIYNRWEGDLEPFAHFDDGEAKKMLRVDFGPSNEGGSPMMYPVTADSIRERLDEEGDLEPLRISLEFLEQDFVDENSVVLVFYDEFMTQRHGFPFDMSLLLERG